MKKKIIYNCQQSTTTSICCKLLLLFPVQIVTETLRAVIFSRHFHCQGDKGKFLYDKYLFNFVVNYFKRQNDSDSIGKVQKSEMSNERRCIFC